MIDEKGVAADPDKVQAITAMTERDLMMEDEATPSQKKIVISWDGNVLSAFHTELL